jgi:hypothetical protein
VLDGADAHRTEIINADVAPEALARKVVVMPTTGMPVPFARSWRAHPRKPLMGSVLDRSGASRDLTVSHQSRGVELPAAGRRRWR